MTTGNEPYDHHILDAGITLYFWDRLNAKLVTLFKKIHLQYSLVDFAWLSKSDDATFPIVPAH